LCDKENGCLIDAVDINVFNTRVVNK